MKDVGMKTFLDARKSQILNLLYSFCHRKSANFLDVQFRKSQIPMTNPPNS
jgi:hypothetical protein